jgi:NAD-dependent deacetylase
LRPGVVWFGEALPQREIDRVEMFLAEGECDVVIVVGTTAAFGYITGWALEAAGKSGVIVEVNPEETQLSGYAHHGLRAAAGVVLPELVEAVGAER